MQWRSSATADSLRNIFQSLSEIMFIKKPLCLAGNIRIIFHGHRQRVGCVYLAVVEFWGERDNFWVANQQILTSNRDMTMYSL